tara:strand:+ start:1604 stop:2332 length:729 start_codon:yes stop_codon:yes gene_type:complete
MPGISAGLGGQVNNNIQTTGLVGYWDPAYKKSYPRTGTTWFDLSGFENDGTLSGSPTFSTSNGGVFDFDGTDDRSNHGDDTSLDITSTITLSIWVNFDTNGTPSCQLIGRDAVGTSNRSYEIMGYNGDGLIYYQNWTGGTNNYVAWDNGTWQSGVWYCLTATYDGSYDRIYLNGVLNCTPHAHTGDIDNNDVSFIIGSGPDASGAEVRYVNGQFGPALVYNRALSAGEVLQNYNAQKQRFGV